MPTPVGFPKQINTGVSWGGGNDAAGGNSPILAYSSTVLYWIGFNYATLVIEVYKSLDAGATWALLLTGPSFADDTVAPFTFEYGSVAVNTTTKKLHVTYWGTTRTICGVTFDATTETLGVAEDSGVAYTGTFNAAGVVAPMGFGSACRLNDGVVWIQYGSMDAAVPPPYQQVFVMKWNPGAGFSAPVSLGFNTTNFRGFVGTMVADTVNNTIWGLAARISEPAATSDLYAFSISPADAVSALTNVYSGNASNTIVDLQGMGFPAVDTVNQKILFAFNTGNISANFVTKIAYGDLGGFVVTTAPATLQPTGVFTQNYLKQAIILSSADTIGLNWAYGPLTFGQAFYSLAALPAGWYIFFQFYDAVGNLFFWYGYSNDSGVTWAFTNYAELFAADAASSASIQGALLLAAPTPAAVPTKLIITPFLPVLLPDPRVLCRFSEQVKCVDRNLSKLSIQVGKSNVTTRR
jgi:hypothetical protein